MIIRLIIKILVTALIVAGVSEIAKRSTFIGSILVSLPLTSLLAMIWLYRDTHDVQKVIGLSYGTFWLVVPSLVFLVIFPLFLKQGIKFPFAMLISSGVTALVYVIYMVVLKKLGIKI